MSIGTNLTLRGRSSHQERVENFPPAMVLKKSVKGWFYASQVKMNRLKEPKRTSLKAAAFCNQK